MFLARSRKLVRRAAYCAILHTLVVLGLSGCARVTGPVHSAPAVAPSAPPVALPGGAATVDGVNGASPGPSGCPRAQTLDAREISTEAACLLARYVRIDTSNPPGNEGLAASFLKGLLEAEGIGVTVLEPARGRANLLARLSFGRGKAIALTHHMDVVPAVAGEWSVPPFAAEVRDGVLWGRGALDDKAGGIMSLLTMLMAKRLGLALPYDLMLLALADEEAGGGLGARYVVSERADLVQDVAFVMNEGGGILLLPDGRAAYQVEVAQKAPLWLRIVARGPAGHGAAPSAAMATARLSRALARLADYRFPIEVLPQVQELYQHKAASLPEPLQQGARDLKVALEHPAYREAFMREPHHAALVHNTLAITMLRGSDKENVIPGEASAVLDLRLLPGQAAPTVIAEVTRVIADPEVEVETLLSWTAHSTPRDTPLFRAIEAAAQRTDPGAPVLANVIGGFTDCNAFRARGIQCYGFRPLRLAPDAFAGMHGKDERAPLAALGEAVVAWLALLGSLPAPSAQ